MSARPESSPQKAAAAWLPTPKAHTNGDVLAAGPPALPPMFSRACVPAGHWTIESANAAVPLVDPVEIVIEGLLPNTVTQELLGLIVRPMVPEKFAVVAETVKTTVVAVCE